ncbi:translation initiation factor IF-2 [Pelagibacteraceae bacterium]|nr:translation initiation factor IF-2 [Pelagibacteraceae bacterium]
MSKEKKKKLTLKNFKGTPRKFNDNSVKTQGKVVVERKNPNFKPSNNNLEKKTFQKPFAPKITPPSGDNQKNAKEWAKKKIQEELYKGKKKVEKKTELKKRDYKLTLSRALSDEDEIERQRSFASVKRAREKQTKKIETQEDDLKITRDVSIPSVITIQELANRMAEKSSAIIKYLLEKNVKVTVNHSIDADTAEFIVGEFGHNPIRGEVTADEIKKIVDVEKENKGNDPRPPVVTVMGHVDHGKTSLLDSLREADVVSTEHGGITQHIGAYQVKVNDKNLITFIDTPGHAAFTEMRARGSKITDIVILVVAANDGIKPQTIEAIQHSKAAGVPIIVAVNKCDLPGVDTRKVKNQLLEHELVVEELGGDILCVEISALKKTNLDKLKENIVLQSELLDLKTFKNTMAKGVVIESRLDKGKGPVSTILVTSGTLKRGDIFVSGSSKGRVRAMFDFNGKQISSAEPSTPVEVIGFESVTSAGDDFAVLNDENKISEILEFRQSNSNKVGLKATSENDDIFGSVDKAETLNIVVKADVHGSLEAISAALLKIEIEKIKPKIILSAVGPVTETDVTLAKASNAKILGFNVRPNKEAKELANSYKMEISYFNIIYEAIDFVEKSITGKLEPQTKEESIGQCEILEVFNVSKAGKVAGVKVTQGEVRNNSDARLIRDGVVVYTGKIGSLFREKNEAKEVKSGLECGLTIKDFIDYKKGDIVEIFQTVTVERV